jgi:transcriptional regulator with XRE-family HTH domain
MVSVDQRIGLRIRGKRQALGLSEEGVATALGVTAETIAAYERAALRVPPEHLTKLAEIMGVTVSYFML